MIGRHRIGLLAQALMLLGVGPVVGEAASIAARKERELADLMGDISAAGLDAVEIKLAFGEREFMVRARLCLQVNRVLQATEQVGKTHDVISLVRDMLGQERPAITAPPMGSDVQIKAAGHRGPGRQLRDERERVGEPLRVLAAYAGLTPVEIGEIERGIRIPTAEEWAALQAALPELGEMEAPPTEAERSPVVIDQSLSAAAAPRGAGLDRAIHPAGRCTCAQQGTCRWCEMDRRREIREARKTTRAAMQVSLGAQALRGAEVDYRTAKQERRAAKSRRKARKGWA